MTPPLVDAEAREAIATALDRSLIVEAAAGTGKTTALVGRIVALLSTGAARLSRLVAVTFTEKAAGEMKLRLRTELERARTAATADAAVTARLHAAIEELESAHIGTIHGFCAELLRQRPVEAKVDPAFEVGSEDSNQRLYDEAFGRWFQSVLADPPEGVRRLLRRRMRRDDDGARGALHRAGLDCIDQRDFPTPWRRPTFDRDAAIDAVIDAVAAAAALVDGQPRAGEKDWLVRNLQELGRFVDELRRKESLVPRDHDGLEEELRTLRRTAKWQWRGGRWPRRTPSRDEALRLREAAKARLDELVALADADLAACLQRDLAPLIDAYEAAKRRAGRLDFLDLLLETRDLLRDDRAVRNELQARFTHVLVDEFQDTDPLQAEILLLLCADDPAERRWEDARPLAGKLFVVGDPKQAIYRFRRADVTLYERIKRRLLAHGATLLRLSTSFRAAPSIQASINAAFAPRMQGSDDGSQADYVPLAPFRDEPVGRPTVIALPVPRPYSDWGKVVHWRVDESLPDAVGGFVEWLVHRSGWTFRHDGVETPFAPRHVCLLFKRFSSFGSDVTRPYVRALEARRLPHVLVGGKSFHAREEVLAMRNALAAIEWPDDELAVFATLRGPLFALADEQLLVFRRAHGGFHPLRAHDVAALDPLSAPVAEALAVLGALHRGRNRRPLADTASQLLEATRAHAGLAIWPTGEQALANVARIVDQARRFEAAGASSFRAFVEHLDAESERGGAAEAPVVEEGTDGVRIMTVHKAKGLEFPVVILVDPTCPPAHENPSRFIDATRKLWARPLAGCAPLDLVDHRDDVLRHDRAEAVRLAYVAATRARELLVVPAVGDAPIEGWLEPLTPALYPTSAERRRPRSAGGCPPFGDDSVLERPLDVEHLEGTSVRPGLHRAAVGAHDVVWWDPRALALDVEEQAGVRQQRILSAEGAPEAAADGKRLHDAWSARRDALLQTGTAPTRTVRTATAAKSAPTPSPTPTAAAPAIAIAIETTGLDRRVRPRGKRFGALVHASLAVVDLSSSSTPPPVAIEAVVRAQARMLGADDAEVLAAVAAVEAALAHPLLRRAAASTAVRRECPVLVREPDGSLTEGVLDLAFRDAAGWTVVDFKTDVELAARAGDYAEQVRAYARAIAAATGEPVAGVLLSV